MSDDPHLDSQLPQLFLTALTQPSAPASSPPPPNSTFTALAMSDELRLDWKLQRGDIPIINNLSMLHAKSAFKVSPVESVEGVAVCVNLRQSKPRIHS